MFAKGSRYENVEAETITDARGREIRCIKVRYLPKFRASALSATYVIQQGERLDHIAHRAYREPQRFWRICDANEAMWPDDLVAERGRKIVIPLAED